jgi:hypothetical protein
LPFAAVSVPPVRPNSKDCADADGLTVRAVPIPRRVKTSGVVSSNRSGVSDRAPEAFRKKVSVVTCAPGRSEPPA